jgi:hypothetical protein
VGTSSSDSVGRGVGGNVPGVVGAALADEEGAVGNTDTEVEGDVGSVGWKDTAGDGA